jgi:hypothetical protein
MKVLLLYKDANHALPLRRLDSGLLARGIELEYYNTRSMQDCRDCLHIKSDLLVVYSQLMASAIAYEHAPILMVDRIDGGQLAQSRPWLEHPNVVGVMKGYRYKPPELNNVCKGRYSAHLLNGAGVKATREAGRMSSDNAPDQLSEEALNRIYLMYGFGGYDHVSGCENTRVDFATKREVDCQFRATMSYSGSEIETHRRLAYEQLQSYRGGPVLGLDRRRLGCPQYRKKMIQCKTELSPWGCGEPCHRDYEAWLLGTVLLKPNSDFIDCWPPHYKAGETYIPVKMDFSDLHEKIAWVRNNWAQLRPMREECRRLVLRTRGRAYRADRMAAVFWGALHRKGMDDARDDDDDRGAGEVNATCDRQGVET